MAALANTPNKGGATPLHLAAAYDRVEVCEWFVYHGGDLHTLDQVKGWGAIHTAAGNGRLDVMRMLLSARPDLAGLRSRDGLDAGQIAQMNGFDECAAFFARARRRQAKGGQGKGQGSGLGQGQSRAGYGGGGMDTRTSKAVAAEREAADAAAGQLIAELEHEAKSGAATQQAKRDKASRKKASKKARQKAKQGKVPGANAGAGGSSTGSVIGIVADGTGETQGAGARGGRIVEGGPALLESSGEPLGHVLDMPSRGGARDSTPPPSPPRHRTPPTSPTRLRGPPVSPLRWSNNAANSGAVVEERRAARIEQRKQSDHDMRQRDTPDELSRMLRRCVHLDPHARRNARQQFAESSVPSNAPVEVRKSNDEQEWHIVYSGMNKDGGRSNAEKAIITFSPSREDGDLEETAGGGGGVDGGGVGGGGVP